MSSFVHIKKKRVTKADGEPIEVFAVQSMAIQTGQGKKLIPNPAGTEADLYKSFDEAVAVIRRAGFDYSFEGRQVVINRDDERPRKATTVHALPADDLNQAVPTLIERLRDREAAVVGHAAVALGYLGDPQAIGPLSEILGHDDPTVRRSVAEAMGQFGENALNPLADAYQRAQQSKEKQAAYVRLTVMSSYIDLIHRWPELAHTVIENGLAALNDDSWLVRSAAAQLIGAIAKQQADQLEEGSPT